MAPVTPPHRSVRTRAAPSALRHGRLNTAVVYMLLCAAALTVLVPLFWLVSTAFKPFDEIFAIPPLLLPSSLGLDNLTSVFTSLPFAAMMLNSIKIAGLSALGQVVSCSMAGYAFARLHFVGRTLLFLVCVATLLVPYHVTMIPIFAIMKSLGWVNTHTALIVPAWLGGGFGIFLMRQFLLTLPEDLEDAGKMDGANPVQIFGAIILPLAQPGMTALAIISFTNAWNDLIGPLIYLTQMEQMTMTVGLTFFKGMHGTQWNLLMAGALLSLLPAAVLFFIAQRHLISGISLSSAMKG